MWSAAASRRFVTARLASRSSIRPTLARPEQFSRVSAPSVFPQCSPCLDRRFHGLARPTCAFPPQKSPNILEHPRQHLLRQFPRKRILLARMVRRKKPRQISRQSIGRSMTKRKFRQAPNLPALLQQSQVRPHRNAPQRQNRPRTNQFQLSLEVRPAIRELRRQRLIRGRCAPHRRRNIRILQSKPVIPVRGRRLIRKPRAKKRLVKKISRPVPSEYAPRPIPAMRRRRKPQDQQPRTRIAEARHRLAPILALAKRPPFFPRDFLAIAHQPRTLPTAHNLLVQLFKLVHRRAPRNLPRNRRRSRHIYSLSRRAQRKSLRPAHFPLG